MSTSAITPIYASEIVSGFDVWKPEILNDLFKRYGDQGMSYFMLLKSMGFEKPVAADTFYHYEDNLKHPTFKVRANVASPGAGNDMVLKLSAADVDANNRYYPRKWDTVLFPNEVTGQIVDIDVSTPAEPELTIRPNKTADNIGALTAGTELSIISGAFSEGSGQPRGAVTGATKYDNDMQIIKETIEVTGTELTNQTWLQLKAIQGAPWYTEGLDDLDYRFALKCEGALLFQKRTDNTGMVDNDTGRAVKTTEGLIPYLRRLGNLHPYTAGSFAVSDFDTIDRTLDREFAGNLILALQGIELSQEIENLLKDYLDNTNIEYARKVVNNNLFNKNESLAVSVNFSLLTKSERTFMFKRMGSFSNRSTYGTETSKTPQMGVYLPVNEKKDPVNSEMVRSIGMRYKALGPYSRKTEIWDVSGAGPGLKVTDLDKKNSYMRGHIGAQHRGGNQMVLVHT